MTRHTPAALATPLVVLTVLALAGCGSSSASGATSGRTSGTTSGPTAPATPSSVATSATAGTSVAAAGSTDACGLLTAADISTAVGTSLPVQGPAESIGGSATQCTWGNDSLYVRVEVGDAEIYRVAASSATAQVAGPWDQGSYFTAVTGTSMAYLKGSTAVAIQVFNVVSDGPDVAHVTALATATVGRL